MTVEQLQVVISAQTDPIQKKLKEVEKRLSGLDKTTQNSTKSMQKSFNKTVGSISKMKLALIGIGIAAAKVGKAIFSMGSDAATADNQVMALSRTMGNSSGEFIKWAQDAAVEFGISERAAVSFGNQFSSIIARTEKNGEAVSDLTQEYLKMGAVIAANTHFEIDDVMGRIRSGLSGRNEAIEDLGIEVKPNVIKGTEAYAAAVRSGGVAWEQMTDAQQANVRTQAILEQAQKRYGTGLQGTAGKLAVLKAAVDNMKLAWGRAFAPIVEFIIPVLQKMVGWLTIAATYVRAFLGLFFKVSNSTSKINKSTQQLSNTMGDTAAGAGDVGTGLEKANKAAKKLQRTLFGFDVIHNIDEPQDSAAGGSADGTGGIGGIGVPEIDLGGDGGEGVVTEMMDKIKEKVEATWARIKAIFEENKVAIISILAALTAGLATLGIISMIPKLTAFFGTIGSGIGLFKLWVGEMGFLKGSFNLLVTALGSTTLIIASVVLVVMAVAGAIAQLWQTNDNFRANVIQAWNGIKDSLANIYNTVIKPILESFKTMLLNVWNHGIKPLWDGWVEFVRAIVEAMLALWNVALKPFVDWFVKTFGPVLAGVFDFVSRVISFVMATIGQVIGLVFKNIAVYVDTLVGVFKGITMFLKGVFTGDWRMAWNGVVAIFSSLFWAIPKIFGNVWTAVMKLFSSGGTIFKGFATSVADIFKELVNSLIRGINTVIGAPFKALNTALKRFKGISILGAKPFNWLPTIGIPTIPQFATGGFPEDGLFHANSTELVGKFTNGKTAVVNNAQIIEGVSAGVANAVSQVMGKGQSSNQPIHLTVQIGSNTIAKEIISAVDDYTMKTGMTFKTI